MSRNTVIAKPWEQLTPDEVFEMAKLRSDVFYLEQKITEEELDRFDRASSTRHYWIEDAGGFAAYLRLVRDATDKDKKSATSRSIGRVVVRSDRRGEGLAQLLIERVVADLGEDYLLLHSQVYVTDLYHKFGFREFGEQFDEAGIPHIAMLRQPDEG